MCRPNAQVTGTKAELAVRLLEAFELKAPLPCPAYLLRVLAIERSAYGDGDGRDGCADLRGAAWRVLGVAGPGINHARGRPTSSLAALRTIVVDAGYDSMAALVAAAWELSPWPRSEALQAG